MNALLPAAETIAKRLIARHETIATAESSTGGLIATALLAVPGASAYFLGGVVVYTGLARAALLGIGDAEMQGIGCSCLFCACGCRIAGRTCTCFSGAVARYMPVPLVGPTRTEADTNPLRGYNQPTSPPGRLPLIYLNASDRRLPPP